MMFTGQRSVFRNQANNEDRKWLFHLERGTKLCAAQKMPILSRRRRKSRRLGRIDQWTIVIGTLSLLSLGCATTQDRPDQCPAVTQLDGPGHLTGPSLFNRQRVYYASDYDEQSRQMQHQLANCNSEP